MTRDDIIRMAIEAGVKPTWIEDGGVMYWGDLHRFADVVAAEQVPDIAIELARYKALAGELAEAAKLAESALAFIYGGEPLDPSGAIAAMRTALAKYEQESKA